MADEDHLDKQTEVSAELTKQGFGLKAKSRLIAGFDRLGGNLAELLNVHIERHTEPRRARIEGERRLIEAAVDYGIERLGKDDEFAERMLANQLGKMERAQANKDGVMQEALNDLRDQPLNAEEGSEEPETLSPVFLDRFEVYAKQASTDELRHRWGRVLAAEIRKPGTFSQKVLRVVDELDRDTALLFESLCKSRIGDALPRHLVGEISFPQIVMLTSAGLLVEPGMAGQLRVFSKMGASDGNEYFVCPFPHDAIAYRADAPAQAQGNFVIGNEPGIRIYVLTDVGFAVSQILSDTESDACSRLLRTLNESVEGVEFIRFHKDGRGSWSVLS